MILALYSNRGNLYWIRTNIMSEANLQQNADSEPDAGRFFDTAAASLAQPVVPLEQIQTDAPASDGVIYVPVSPARNRFSNAFLLTALLGFVVAGSVLSTLFYISYGDKTLEATASAAEDLPQINKPDTEKPLPVISKNNSAPPESKTPRNSQTKGEVTDEPDAAPVDVIYENSPLADEDEAPKIKRKDEGKRDKKREKLERKIKKIERDIRNFEDVLDDN